MIYQIHGFNIVCDQYIEKLKDYISDKPNENLPTINTKITTKSSLDIPDGVEVFNNWGTSIHSKRKSYYRFLDGSSILLSPREIIFCGDNFDAERLFGEISRANIVDVSRFHNRAVLHGSAFFYEKKAYLLCAYPGAGKSTLSSAITKYHSNVCFITDDIICVTKDGTSIYNGVHHVSLNDDSFKQLFDALHDQLITRPSNSIINPKTTYDLSSHRNLNVPQNIVIGGVFFLDTPIEDQLIDIKELNKFEFLCEAIKNIKARQSLISELLTQEMQILNSMVQNNIFGVKLRIKHDYSNLQKITNMIVSYINNRNKNEP